jgi:NTP pyrophosphatase (non-canonical NTP hydrolase)
MEKIPPTSDLHFLREEIREFVEERDWRQFNTPKNLASALCVEAAELLEPFQWLQTGALDELDEVKLGQIRKEIADVQIYLIALADNLNVDIKDAVVEKMIHNRSKYPKEKVRGSARKYSEYD